ncbi:MAG: hypothetical protein K2X03_20590 [Bryobacteraceae bacterium]|nr:hypothetical protein [Bryobacteraceae bacterium]
MYETSLLDTASIEGVSLANKLDLAGQELGGEILRFLIQQLEPAESIGPGKLDQVVATDPLRRWHALRTLAIFFRDVHHNQLNDRYRAKWNAYEAEAKSAARLLWEVGVGTVRNPLRRPMPPVLEILSTDDEYPQLLFKTTWVTGNGAESAASGATLFAGGIGLKPQLTVNNPPQRATGWNIYAGVTEATLSRQTPSPLPLNEVWVMLGNQPVSGSSVPDGQAPDQYVRLQRLLFRG